MFNNTRLIGLLGFYSHYYCECAWGTAAYISYIWNQYQESARNTLPLTSSGCEYNTLFRQQLLLSIYILTVCRVMVKGMCVGGWRTEQLFTSIRPCQNGFWSLIYFYCNNKEIRKFLCGKNHWPNNRNDFVDASKMYFSDLIVCRLFQILFISNVFFKRNVLF